MNALFLFKRAANAWRQSKLSRPAHGPVPKAAPRSEGITGLKAGLIEGERLQGQGQLVEAEKWYSHLLEQGDGKNKRGRRAHLLLALASVQWRQKKFSEATAHATAALESLDSGQQGSEIAECNELLAEIAIDQENYDVAVVHRQQALQAQSGLRTADTNQLIERRRKLAEAFRLAMRCDEARGQAQAALDLALRECGEMNALTARCHVDLGTIEAAAGNGIEARRVLERALDIHIAVCGPESEETAGDLRGLAKICTVVEDFEGAEGYYERALYLRERQVGGSMAELAALLMEMGETQSMLGRFGPAAELMQQAVGRFEGLHDERLAPSLDRLATVYLLSGRMEDSIKALKKARAVYGKAPDRFRHKLEQNADLFTVVAGYLSPKNATALMDGIGGPASDATSAAPALGTPGEFQPELAATGPTRKREGVPDGRKALPEAPDGQTLETWGSLDGKDIDGEHRESASTTKEASAPHAVAGSGLSSLSAKLSLLTPRPDVTLPPGGGVARKPESNLAGDALAVRNAGTPRADRS